ncbi:group I intron-associated PD-(D/E)XK endonuclease [Thalassoroseus pseudoceratinae]|uniref:group I intron-associated PD-(D/E)XK endonuclease n=1 Tax=Thalassoroseus pseudoceratinae TaxID=2713176 RepID=UPI00142013D2|nr:group I intron-associated PD-(D/E)XK endonuclease [Thalassoroseus pseudoceratinae]
MPKRLTHTKPATVRVLKNTSFESLVVSWLMQDGWQVFVPILDNAHKTDLLISDGPHYYRIQVKTVDAVSESHVLENRWKESNIDVVVVFARNSNWGYVLPAFKEKRRKLKSKGHLRFQQTKNTFLKAFHAL